VPLISHIFFVTICLSKKKLQKERKRGRKMY